MTSHFEEERLVGKTIAKIHGMSCGQAEGEEESFVLVFTDGTRVGFYPTGYVGRKNAINYWVDARDTLEWKKLEQEFEAQKATWDLEGYFPSIEYNQRKDQFIVVGVVAWHSLPNFGEAIRARHYRRNNKGTFNWKKMQKAAEKVSRFMVGREAVLKKKGITL